MKKINKNLTIALLSITFTLLSSSNVFAATNPSLGAASTFSVLAQTAITGISTISGDVGMNSSGASITALTTANVAGLIYATDLVLPSEGIISATVQANASTVYTATIPGLPIENTPIVGAELNGIIRGPGVYDLAGGAITLSGGVLTLDGPGTYIFRTSAGFTSSGSINLINGARACDVFWNIGSLATINGSSFVGTILAGTGVHIGSGVTLNGRALAIGGDVTMLNDTISGPTCVNPATLHVVKLVVNTSGGTAIPSNFNIHVKNAGVNVLGSPQVGASAPGTLYSLVAGTYVISEDTNTSYTQSFTGACNSSGSVTLLPDDNKTCTIVNTYIPVPAPSIGGGGGSTPVIPIISVTKVPSTFNLPNGGGLVTYNYTVLNVSGQQRLTVTIADNKCTPISFISGDTNNNSKLDPNEIWKYSCVTRLSNTTTNTVTATGVSDDIYHQITKATAVATVIVSTPQIATSTIPQIISNTTSTVAYTYYPTFPNTGLEPTNNSVSSKTIAVLALILVLLLSLILIKRKQTV